MNAETLECHGAVAGQVERSVRPLGPVLTDQDGNLSRKIWMCAWRGHRCAHYSVHDWHYSYCAAQKPDSAPALRPGAGQQLRSGTPNDGCPYMRPNVRISGTPGLPGGSA